MSQYTSSAPRSPTDGMAMNWVLDHVLTHPDPYQSTLPLRTIYALNSHTSSAPSDFKTMLMEHLSKMPSQPCTLPPVFLTTFIKKCFPQRLEDVDFDLALTALDYLRDLEIRRQRELEKAIGAQGQYGKKIVNLRSRSAKLDLIYAKALVGIRRWTLINELSLPRFNKCNCVAMLNTLYPIEEPDINSHLTAPVLKDQRLALWKYISTVEKKGPSALDPVRNANGGWERVYDAVYLYSRLALQQIQRAEDLSRPSSFGSFQSDSSVELEPTSPKHRLATPQLTRCNSDSSEEDFSVSEKRSTLEKIVRGLAKLGGSRSKLLYNNEWNSSSRGTFSVETLVPTGSDNRMRLD